jgi:16S rRNA (guanine527-N7)-methyltransferase
MIGAEVSQETEAQIRAGMAELGLTAELSAAPKLAELVRLLMKWNRTYNLTAIRDEALAVSHHLLDSLVLARYIGDGSVLDVGTGGGFPGLPLALVRPECRVTLLDSNQKKTAFVRDAIATLGLANCAVVCERVERWKSPAPFRWIVSRAFAELADFLRGAAHLLARDGVFVALKGVHPAGEMARVPADFRIRNVERVQVPGVDAERHLVFVERS